MLETTIGQGESKEAFTPETTDEYELHINGLLTELGTDMLDYLTTHEANDQTFPSKLEEWRTTMASVRATIDSGFESLLGQNNKRVTALVGPFAHDVRGEMMKVRGYIEMMKRGVPNVKDGAIGAVKDMLQTLTPHELEALRVAPASVSTVIEVVTDEIQRREPNVENEAQQHRQESGQIDSVEPISVIHVQSSVDSELQFDKVWDKHNLLTKAVLEIARNAMKSMKDDTLKTGRTDRNTTIQIHAYRTGPNELTIDVIDNGPGIAPKDGSIQWVFEPGQTNNVLGSGTGNGLDAHRESVRTILGGDVTVDETYQAGTRFSITIPMEPVTLQDLHVPAFAQPSVN